MRRTPNKRRKRKAKRQIRRKRWAWAREAGIPPGLPRWLLYPLVRAWKRQSDANKCLKEAFSVRPLTEEERELNR